jgi:tRNA (guanine37-N1)-methyltransferase
MLRIDIITLFPELFTAWMINGINRRAFEHGLVQAVFWNPRDFTKDNYRRVDDRPYGGGPGMVMLPQPLAASIQAAKARHALHGIVDSAVIYLSAQGVPCNHATVMNLSKSKGIIILCGRYEGIDQRIINHYITQQICVGDFVVSGGELPAMMVLDAALRLIPGVLNDLVSTKEDSFYSGGLDHVHYTRPKIFENVTVPAVLMSGNHINIKNWRMQQAHALTQAIRPDLLKIKNDK